jgi:hypothetical protein
LLGVAPGDDCACLGVALSMSRKACGTTSSRRDAALSSASLAKRWRNRCPGCWRVTTLPSRVARQAWQIQLLGDIPPAIASGAHGQPSPSKLGDRIRCNASSPHGSACGGGSGGFMITIGRWPTHLVP